MVWSAWQPIAVGAVILSLFLAAVPPGAAKTEPQVFFADPFDDLDGWTTGEGWTITDNRAHNGTALYMGDDRGTPSPFDNGMECDPCRTAAASPAFAIPSGSAAYAYFWFYGDFSEIFGGGFSLLVDDGSGTLQELKPIAPMRDVFMAADLSAFAGQTVSLVFDVDLEFAWSSDEGIYLDDLLVTDLAVQVAHDLSAQAADAYAAEMAFTVPEGGAKATLILDMFGREGDASAAVFTMVYLDGELVSGFGFQVGSLEPSLRVNLLGTDVVNVSVGSSSGGFGMSGRMTMWMNEAPAGHYRVFMGIIGVQDTMMAYRMYAGSALGAFQAGIGGHELAAAPPNEYRIGGAHVSAYGRTPLLVDGSYTLDVPDRAVGLIGAIASHSVDTATLPDGSTTRFGGFSDTPGVWRHQVDLAVNGWSLPWFMLVSLPALADPVDLPEPDLSALPGIGDGTDPGPGPEPEPWPSGYNVTQTAEGRLVCALSAGPVQTTDLCTRYIDQGSARFDLPLDNGTTSLSIALHSPGGVFGDARLCAYVARPIQDAGPACSGDGKVEVWRAAEGEARISGNETITIDVRVARDGGFTYEQPFTVEVETAHWGGAGA